MADKKGSKFTPLDQLAPPSVGLPTATLPPEKRAIGRPSLYDPEKHPTQAFKLCLLGATDVEMAEFFEVHEDTVNEWKKQHPEFSGSIKAGKTQADAEVANGLYDRARGFQWDEAQPIKLKEVTYENGKRLKEIERVETVIVHKVAPPDTAAAFIWLKNRRSKAPADATQWRDRVEHTGADGGPLEISWQMPAPAAGASPVIEGDAARDITPRTPERAGEASLPDGEPIAVAWNDAAPAKPVGPGNPNAPKRGDKP